MTNNTQLLPCPFCGGRPSPISVEGHQECSNPKCPIMGQVFSLDEWSTRAGPVEDVRAVVEEPVAWEMNDSAGESGLILVTNDKSLRDEWVRDELPVCPLFSHPPRTVVLPERKRSPLSSGDEKWNACLDAVEELNK